MSGIYILYASTTHSPPILRTFDAAFAATVQPAAYPLVCSLGAMLQLLCQVDGAIYTEWALINANSDGNLELGIGNGAGSFVASANLFVVSV